MYEGPSQDDINRFSSDETGFCPHCGKEVWDDVNQCPSCGSWMQDGASHRDPVVNVFRNKMIVLIVVMMLIGFLYGVLRLF
tara:strand:+ start:284 stop:526 length:243 start_codon:yes stop_codon:yes gene_type:complete